MTSAKLYAYITISIFTVTLSLPSLTLSQTSAPNGKDLVAQITYAEGKSFRGSPTSSVPSGTQYCGPNSSMGSDQDKQDAMTDMARVILARQHCGLKVGDGTGTAKPEKPPQKPLASEKSSWTMAGKAADQAQAEWDAKSQAEKDKECKTGSLYFFHLCYCCIAINEEGDCIGAVQVSGIDAELRSGTTELALDSESFLSEGSVASAGCVLPSSGGSCGCPKSGNNASAAGYSRVACPCCPHQSVPDWWGDAPQSTSGSSLYDPNTGCWRETKVRRGGK